MKNTKYILAIGILLAAFTTFAQSNMEDVMYLKNGSVYRGNIIEQTPGESYKIQIAGGSIFFVTVAEVQKIIKEPIQQNTIAYGREDRDYGMGYMYHHRDTSRSPSYLRKRKFFSALEFRPGINNIGLRIVHGYKFNRFANFGIGFGVDAVSFGNRISDGRGIFDNRNVNNGIYLPLYIHYSGEILQKRITPYYYLEAGYAAHPSNPFVSSRGNKSWGGPIGAAGIGCKFYSKNRGSFAININANWRTDRYRSTITTTDVFGNSYSYTERGTKGKLFGAIGLAIGF
jgi:hypothetical protein